MLARRLANGNLLIPRRAETDGVVGDGMIEIGPDDPEWAAWDAEARATEPGLAGGSALWPDPRPEDAHEPAEKMRRSGFIAGRAAGEGRADPNTTSEACRALLSLIEDGDPDWHDSIPHPFSGADGWTSERAFEDAGVDRPLVPEYRAEDALVDAWCEGFRAGYEDEVVRACEYHLAAARGATFSKKGPRTRRQSSAPPTARPSCCSSGTARGARTGAKT